MEGRKEIETVPDGCRGGFSTILKGLLPSILGLAFARSGLIAATYGAYRYTDENVFTDGSMLFTLFALAVFMVVSARHKISLSQHAVLGFAYVTIALEACAIVALGFFDLVGARCFGFRFASSVICSFGGSLSIFYWLRCTCGSDSVISAVFCFAALAVSEVELYLCALMPPYAGCSIAGALVLAQYACIVWRRSSFREPSAAVAANDSRGYPEEDFFSFGKIAVNDAWILASVAIGIGTLSVVIGFLRGYPSGQSIEFTFAGRLSYGLFTLFLSMGIIVLVLRGHRRTLTVGIFICMELLACAALMLYALLPENLQVGAVFTTTLNALMVGYTWYVIIAFASHGQLDAYYYAGGCWLVWLGFRAVARMASLKLSVLAEGGSFIIAFMGALVVVSTQVVFMQYLNVATDAAELRMLNAEDAARREKEEREKLLMRIMGLDGTCGKDALSMADMREETMRHSAEEMGRQFLLSDREVEVLTLYALGYTQKRVAEKLYISQGTAHAHIKNIYTKTNLHSRQELIDYLKRHTK